SNAQAGVYTITRTANSVGAVTVNLTWSGTAASTRYTRTVTGGTLNAAGTQLTMPDGGTSATIVLTPVADGILEAAQTAVLTLASATTYAVGSPSTATVTLYDTTNPTISISPTTMSQAVSATSSQTITLTVSLSGSSPIATTVTVKTVNGTAVAGTNYTAVSTTLTFAAGATSQTVTVTILKHSTGTSNKTFTVVLSSPTAGTLGTTTSTVTITGTSQMAAALAPSGSVAAPLTQDELQPVVAAAEQDWQAAGIARSRLAPVTFVITTLPLGQIGYTVGDTVYIDPTAAGWGWNTSLALPGADQMDLLTVVLHELGHVLGLPDGCACGALHELMQTTLSAGQRRTLPHGSVVGPLRAAGRAGAARRRRHHPLHPIRLTSAARQARNSWGRPRSPALVNSAGRLDETARRA
ncbi:MAG: Calx-beta domain-containing protein, partial [Solirubrobacteraceae bacterium]